MTGLGSILRNSSLLIAAQVVASATSMGLLVLLSRALGNAEFGRLHLALSLTALFAVAAECGLTQVVARAVAREPGAARPYLRRGAALVAGAALVVYAALLATASAMGYDPGVVRLAAILGGLLLAEPLAQLLGAVFQAHERMAVPAAARVAGNAVLLAVAAPLLALGYRAPAVAVAMVLAAGLRVAIQLGAVRRLAGFSRPAAAPVGAPALLAAGLPFLLAQGLGMLVFRLDVLTLGRMAPAATVGWYGAASRLLEAFTILPQLLTMAAFPVAARLWIAAPGEFRTTVRQTFHLLLLLAIPVTVVLGVLARDIVAFLFRLDAFAGSVPVLRIQAVSLTLMFLTFYLVGILMAVGRERVWLAIAATCCVLNPALNWALIPATQARFGNGGIGAALTNFAVEVFILTTALRFVPAGTFGWSSWRVVAGGAGAGALLAAGLVVARGAGVPWPIAAAVGGLAYLAIVLRLDLVPEEVVRVVVRRVARRVAPEASVAAK